MYRSVKDRFQKLSDSIQHPHGTSMYAGQLLYRAAQLSPHHTALICGNESITYHNLFLETTAVSSFLIEKGVQPQQRILILYENSIHFYRAYYGAWQTGAVVVPLNIFLHEKEIEHIIQDAQPSAIIASQQQLKKLSQIINLPLTLTEQEMDQIIQHKTDPSFVPHQLDADELSAILYTSGTTGRPKGVMLSSRNILTNSIQVAALFNTSNKDRAYAALPLFHAYMQNTCVWTSFLLCATTIIIPTIDRAALKQGLAHNPTVILAIPALYGLFSLFKDVSFPSVRYFISGGDALPDKIRMAFELVYRRKLCNGYGMTETAPFIAVDLDDGNEATNTVGYPCYGLEYEIRNENNIPVNPDTIGTLWVKGDNVMLGYYNSSEVTAQVLQNGWLNTGDLATSTKNNKIIICGRAKDLIVNKGVKIYPQEVENILMTAPSVTAAAVIGIPHSHNESIVVAYVATSQKDPNLVKTLQDLCHHNLAPYKVPRFIIVRKELPTTTTGKIDKKSLREEYMQKHHTSS
jgi:long-chain acyl-CoA synthetase